MNLECIVWILIVYRGLLTGMTGVPSRASLYNITRCKCIGFRDRSGVCTYLALPFNFSISAAERTRFALRPDVRLVS